MTFSYFVWISPENVFIDEVRFVLDEYAELEFYSASWLKQQSSDGHVAPLGHIILIQSQPLLNALEASTLTPRER
jgi:hypothetical protein